jgi:transmembrane 9 superfamily member 2/4
MNVQRENTHDAKAEKEAVLFNHAHITINYIPYESKPGDGEKFRIVFFQVTPGSVNYAGASDWKERCAQRNDVSSKLDLQQIEKDRELDLTWSYSVEWKVAANSTYATRWENYIKMQKGEREVHWFSIINSFLIVLFLTGMVAMIMLRTLNADFRRYNSQDPEEADETGWKLVHADVFRPPQRPMLFSALVGNGVQVIGMLVVTMIFAVLGFLSPANHGFLLTAGLVLYVWMGTLAGYFSTRVYKTLKGQNWQKNTVLTAVAFPGVIFGIYFFLNFFLWGQHSSRAIPFGTLVVLIVFWFGISVPLAFFGAYFAWKKPAPDQPVRVNQIPRQVPQQVWYMHPMFSVLLGGILPFGAVFIELFFILASIWLDQVYYLFSFLFIVFIILCITCAEISIVMCYFQLCSEDYHWWWRSYLTSGASALYMFLYSLFYFTTKLEFSSVLAALLYFGYSFIMSVIFFVMTGTIGYYSCYWFVRKIYSSVKFE